MTALLLLSAAGCSGPGEAVSTVLPKSRVFTFYGDALQLTADASFEKKQSQYDLFLTNNNVTLSAQVHSYATSPEGFTPQQVFDSQPPEVLSYIEAVKTVSDVQSISLEQGQATWAVYSARQRGATKHYACYVMDLPQLQSYVCVLVTGMAAYMNSHEGYLHSIVCSLSPAAPV